MANNIRNGLALLSMVACLCACEQKASEMKTADKKETSTEQAQTAVEEATTKETAAKEEEMQQKQQEVHQVSAKHILLTSESEANDLLEKIRKGEISFEEAAKKYSKCPSGKSGGDLGFFGRGMMVKEFEDAAFSMKVGQISAPVKTQFGWHLIKVTELR